LLADIIDLPQDAKTGFLGVFRAYPIVKLLDNPIKETAKKP
jgi:hypothetical protein